MAIGPAHRRLDRQMQAIEPNVDRHLDAAQHRGLDVIERDLETGDGVGTHAASFTTLHLSGPAPWQQCGKVGDHVIVDTGEHIGEPGLRIDVIEPGGLDQRIHHGRPLAAAIGAGEQPRLAPERNAAQLALGRIVGEANPAIIEEAREGAPALEHVVHRLGDVGMAGQPGALAAHPGLEVGNERRDAAAANGQAFLGRQAVDLALDIEDRVDALHRFQRQRRDRRGSLPRALAVMSASTKNLRLPCAQHAASVIGPRLTACFIEPVEAGIGIGLENARIALQMALRVIAGPIARIEEHCRRRIMTAERAVIAHIDPGAPGRRLALGQYRHRRVVAVDAAAGENMRADEIIERAQNHGAAADLVGERREAELNAFAGIPLRLAVERLMLPVLLEQDHGQQARPGKAARQHMERRRGLR